MKKVALVSVVLLLVGSPAFAQQHHGWPSQQQCQTMTHGTCTQQNGVWVGAAASPAAGATAAAPAAAGTATPAATTAATAKTAAPAVTTPTPPAAPTPPSGTSTSSGKSGGWFGFGRKTQTAPADDQADDAAPGTPQEKKKPVDPHMAARGKVYGSEGDCEGKTGGSCKSTDCSTHLGGVCEGNKGTVWSYSPTK